MQTQPPAHLSFFNITRENYFENAKDSLWGSVYKILKAASTHTHTSDVVQAQPVKNFDYPIPRTSHGYQVHSIDLERLNHLTPDQYQDVTSLQPG